jgi:hypothetical protein
MGKGFFESDENYQARVSQEATELAIEDFTGSSPSKGWFESNEQYRSRISEEANERAIEDSTGAAPSKGWFESDERYHSRISQEATYGERSGLHPGDAVRIQIWNPQTGVGPASATVTVVRAADDNLLPQR